MANVRRGEQRRLYSWWWDSHISPKNSKWLKENLTDMDSKVKAMIKLLEEDGDSFAKKAEMYYKKRPELMKLVEEFYRAYRALAERYDHATGVLRQAQRTMSEAFPNQIPLGFMDDSPQGSLANEVEPHTPEMPSPVHAPIDPDDLQKDALGLSSGIHLLRKRGQNSEESDSFSTKKGLKQFNDIFGAENEPARAILPEGRARKGLNFQEEEEENSVNKENIGSSELKREVKAREDEGDTVKSLQQDISRLSTKNLNVKNLIMEESERATKAENELRLLNETLSEFKSKKESDIIECQDKISNLKDQLFNSQNDLKKLNDKMTIKVKKLCDAEELNQSLLVRYAILEKRLNRQENEFKEKQVELEKLLVTLEEKHQQCKQVEVALVSKENLLVQFEEENKLSRIEIKKYIEKLKDMELQNMGLQDEICNINEENKRLNDQNTHLNLAIQELDAEIVLLKEKIRKLDELHVGEMEIVHQEVYKVKEDRDDLERRHQDLIEQISVVSKSSESLQASLKGHEVENSELKELCKKHETDKEVLSEKLKYLETVLEKNMVLENSLSDANVELDDFRQKNANLEKLHESLNSDISIYIHEKEALASQVAILTQKVEKFSEENSFLEESVSRLNSELGHAISKLMDSAQICQSLEDTKAALITEKEALISQVENISRELEDKETKITQLKDEILDLSRKNNLVINQVSELQDLLKIKEKEHGIVVQSYENQLTNLRDHIQLLEEKNLLKQKDLELEQRNFAGALMEIFILKCSLSDLCERNLVLSVEGKKHQEAFRSVEKLASQLEQEKHTQMRDIALLSDHNEKLRKGVHLLKNTLIFEKGSYDVEMKDEVLMNITMDEILRLMTLVREAETDCQQKYLEISILLTLIRQIGLDVVNLKSDCYSLDKKLETETKKLSTSENKIRELTELNEQLMIDIKASIEREELQKLQMNIVTSFLASVVSQIRLDVSKLRSEKSYLESDLRIKAEELLASEKQQHELVGETKQLMKEVDASNLREELLEQLTCIEISVLLTLLKQFGFDFKSMESAKRALEFELDVKTEELLASEKKNHELVDLNNQLKKELEASKCREEQIYLESLVLSTLLKQMTMDVINLRLENVHLEKERQMSIEKILELEEKRHEITGQNEKLIKDVESGNKREEMLKTELQDLQALLQASKCEVSNLTNEKKMTTEELCDMKQKHNVLEEETSAILAEALKLDHLYEFFKCLNAERLLELNFFNAHVDSLSLIKISLNAEVNELSRNISVLESEKKHLMQNVTYLEEEFRSRLLILGFDLNMVTRICEEINDQAENMKNQLMSKEKDLSEASQKFESSIAKNNELCLLLEALQMEHDGVKLLTKELEKKVTSLSEALSMSKEETGGLSEANQVLQTEMDKMHEKVDQLMRKEKHLISELRKEIGKVEQCEEEIAALLTNNQVATVYASLYEEKVHELTAEIEISSIVHKEMLNMEFAITNEHVDELHKNIDALEVENSELKADIDVYLSFVASLEKAIAVLGEQIESMMKHKVMYNLPVEDAALLSHQDYQTLHLNEDHQSRDTARVLLKILITKVEALQKVIEDAGIALENDRACFSSGINVENKEIEGLKHKEFASQEHVLETTNSISQVDGGHEVMISNEIISERGLSMKDIELDQSSSAAAYMSVESYGVRTSHSEINDQLWETAERHSYNQSINKPSITRKHSIEVLEKEPSGKLVAVKEVNSDELVASKRALASQVWSQKILNGLISDAQKLSELDENIEELKTKMARSHMENFPANFGLETLKAQLKAAEGGVTELIDINKKLIKKAEGKLSSDRMETKPEENGNDLRRHLSEQARRESGKVGRLELELQKIQYVLLKLEEEYENRQHKSTHQRTRILLRDYLYGENKGKFMKRRHFCGCMRPKTKDDY